MKTFRFGSLFCNDFNIIEPQLELKNQDMQPKLRNLQKLCDYYQEEWKTILNEKSLFYSIRNPSEIVFKANGRNTNF